MPTSSIRTKHILASLFYADNIMLLHVLTSLKFISMCMTYFLFILMDYVFEVSDDLIRYFILKSHSALLYFIIILLVVWRHLRFRKTGLPRKILEFFIITILLIVTFVVLENLVYTLYNDRNMIVFSYN